MTPTRLAALIVAALVAATVLAWGLTSRPSHTVRRFVSDTGGPAPQDPRAAIFVQHGCQECHAISALGVKAGSDVGPDLTFAYADVVTRYGMSLPSFFENTPGLMGFVLTAHLHLSQADRDSMSRILLQVCREHWADMDSEIPSFPPGRARPGGGQRPGPHSSPLRE